MRQTFIAHKRLLTRGQIARKHRQPYPNLPWLTSHHANFMDNAEHLYGRRDTWGSMIGNAESPTQHYPITILLEGCTKLERKIRQTEKRNRQFAFRAKIAERCTKEWMQEVVANGAQCLSNWESPQRGPREPFVQPIKKKKKPVTESERETESNESQHEDNHDQDINTLPFLRQRTKENPSTLDPVLSEWPKKQGSQREPEVIEVTPESVNSAESDAFSPGEKDLKAEEGAQKPLEKRKAARTVKELLRQRPLFDAHGVFQKHKHESYTKVDWETLRNASPSKGYDGKGAIERKVRLRRGEDV